MLALALGVGLLHFGPSTAAQEPVPQVPANGAEALDAFLARVDSMTAEFSQELWTPDSQLVETATGTLSLKRPNRFLWSYREPIEQLILADGQSLWIYDIDLAQATVTPLDDLIAATPAMLLSGDSAVRDGFEVLESFERGELSWVRLRPRVEGTDFNSVLIGFRDGAPERLELMDGLDQVTRIELSGVELNPELGNDLFQFTAPDDVDVIGSTG